MAVEFCGSVNAIRIAVLVLTTVLTSACGQKSESVRIEATRSGLDSYLKQIEGSQVPLYLDGKKTDISFLVQSGRVYHCASGETKGDCTSERSARFSSALLEQMDTSVGYCYSGVARGLDEPMVLAICVAREDNNGFNTISGVRSPFAVKAGQVFYFLKFAQTGDPSVIYAAGPSLTDTSVASSFPSQREGASASAAVEAELEVVGTQSASEAQDAADAAALAAAAAATPAADAAADAAAAATPVQQNVGSAISDRAADADVEEKKSGALNAAAARTPEVSTPKVSAPELNAGFDCTAAKNSTEASMCSDGRLAKAEGELRDVYRQVIEQSLSDQIRGMASSGHPKWLALRNKTCGPDVDCLMTETSNRARYLKSLIGG